MYSPTIGRFISEDPIDFDAGDANLNRYVSNSPAMMVDPYGLTGYVPKDGNGGFWRSGPSPNDARTYAAGAGKSWWVSSKPNVKPVQYINYEPDFDPVLHKIDGKPVQRELSATGGHMKDVNQAEKWAIGNWGDKYKKLPPGTWHHKSFDPKTGKMLMVYVEKATHTANKHSGAWSKYLDWVADHVKNVGKCGSLSDEGLLALMNALESAEAMNDLRAAKRLGVASDQWISAFVKSQLRKGMTTFAKDNNGKIVKVVLTEVGEKAAAQTVGKLALRIGGKVVGSVTTVFVTVVALNNTGSAAEAGKAAARDIACADDAEAVTFAVVYAGEQFVLSGSIETAIRRTGSNIAKKVGDPATTRNIEAYYDDFAQRTSERTEGEREADSNKSFWEKLMDIFTIN
jgi:glycine cleavage system H lipoate-binding protein